MSERVENAAWPMCRIHPSERAPCAACFVGFVQIIAYCIVIMALVLALVALFARCEPDPIRPSQPAIASNRWITER